MHSLRQQIYFAQKYHGMVPKLLAELDDYKEGVDIQTPPIPPYMRPRKLFGEQMRLFVANIKREMISYMP